MRLANRIAQVSASPTLGITSRAKKMRQDGVDVVGFGAGEPDFETPRHIKDSAIKAISEGFTKYTPSTGIPRLKEAICEKLERDNSLKYEPSQIAVSCGAKHCLYNILQVICNEADEVIIPSPYWVSYPEMVKLACARPVVLETAQKGGFKIAPELLKAKLSKNAKVLILNSPCNPTGSVYTRGELEAIAEVVVQAGIFVISDEIYEHLIYDGQKHVSMASLSRAIYELCLVVNGVSKSYSMTGWRIGYLAGAQEAVRAIGRLQDHSTSNPSSISQMAALAALTGDQGCVRQMREEFQKRRDYMAGRLEKIEKLSFLKPQGTFYIFCDISGLGMGSVEFAQRLLEEAKVAVIPGEGFGWDTHIRLSFATSMENIKKGMDRIEDFIMKGVRS